MIRFWAYLVSLASMVIFCIPCMAGAKGSTPDSTRRTDETFDPGDYDYSLPAEAQSGTIPFTRAGNLIIVQATVDSISGNFILDTGAPGLILNLTYFRHLKASDRADAESGGITGTVHGA